MKINRKESHSLYHQFFMGLVQLRTSNEKNLFYIACHKCQSRHQRYLRAYRKKTFVVFSNKNVFKIVWQESAELMEREFSLNEYVFSSKNSIWSSHATIYSKIFEFSKITIASTSRLPQNASKDQIDTFAKYLLESIPLEVSYQVWWKTLDQDRLERMWKVLGDPYSKLIMSFLAHVKLPVTGAHGDFIDQNILLNHEKVVQIIDWEYWRPQGSVVTDLLRLYSIRHARNMKISEFSSNIFNEFDLPHYFIKYTNLSVKILSILAAITNVCLPATIGPTEKRASILLSSLKDFFE